MTRKPRRLHSVPTGADVDSTSNSVAPINHSPPASPALPAPPSLVGIDGATEPASVPGWPFPLVDLSSLTPDDVAALMDRIGQFSQDGRFQTGQQQTATPSRRRPRRREPVTLRIRVDLDGIKPAIWRRVDLASDLTLDQLHDVLQSVFGWLDMHLHSFVRGDSRSDRFAERYLTAFDVSEGDDGVLESAVRLDELFAERGDKLFYTYDFGDSWEHTLVLESTTARSEGEPAARCVGGRREGPPEDCGGVWGYRELQERGRLLDDPEAFDVAAINDDLDLLEIARAVSPASRNAPSTKLVAKAAVSTTPDSKNTAPQRISPNADANGRPAPLVELLSRSTDPAGSTLTKLLTHIDFSASISLSPAATAKLAGRYSWLLQRVGSKGLPLTAAGYLKPVDVSAAFVELELGNEWIGAGNREVHSLPVLLLRESAQKLGLLRKSHGRLLRTKAGSSVADEPDALLEWIARRLPLGKSPQEKDAGLALLTAICALGEQNGTGPTRSIDQLVAEVLSGLGWRDHDGQPISAMLANLTAELTESVLDQLGVLRRVRGSTRRSITAEGVEFARLALTRY